MHDLQEIKIDKTINKLQVGFFNRRKSMIKCLPQMVKITRVICPSKNHYSCNMNTNLLVIGQYTLFLT